MSYCCYFPSRYGMVGDVCLNSIVNYYHHTTQPPTPPPPQKKKKSNSQSLLFCAVTTVSTFCHCKCTHSQTEWWVCCNLILCAKNGLTILFSMLLVLFHSWTSFDLLWQSSCSWWEVGPSSLLCVLRYGDSHPFFSLLMQMVICGKLLTKTLISNNFFEIGLLVELSFFFFFFGGIFSHLLLQCLLGKILV